MPIYERKCKNGRTVYDAKVDAGRTLEGRREAKVKEAELIALRAAKRNRSGRCIFGQYVERWYWPTTEELAPSSRDTYRRELDLRLLPAFRSTDIGDIDRLAIQQLADSCATASMVRKCISVLKTVLNEAKSDELIGSNPACARYRLPAPGKKRDNGLVITRFCDMRPLMEAVDAYGSECAEKIALIGLYPGLRPEERYGLDAAHFDLADGTVAVEQAFVTASPATAGCT